MDQREEIVTIAVDELKQLCLKRLAEVSVPDTEARIITDILVEADQRGVHSHGVVCLPRYISLIKRGIMKRKMEYETVTDSGAVSVWDGLRSNAQVLGKAAMLHAVERAREYGMAAVAVKNSNHFGAGAYYSELAADAGMIGITVSTGSPTMAPWGGAERMIGNNPLAVAVPVKDGEPILLDMAMSVVAFGKITNLAKQGIPKIPEGWALDEDGRETTDVSKVYSVIPVGTYKGFGLALIIDILSGILFGGATGERAGDDCQGPAQLFIALDIGAFGNSGRFYQELSDRMAELKACRKAEGSGEILFPGELENITRSHSGEYVKLIREIVEELQM